MRRNEGSLLDFIDPTGLDHGASMHCSSRKENDPEGDSEIIRAAFSVSKSEAIASVSVSQMVFNQSSTDGVTPQSFGSTASQSLGGGTLIPAEPRGRDGCPSRFGRQDIELKKIILEP